MAEKLEDPSMAKVHALFEKSGLTLNELGLRMGFPAETARQAAFQFMKGFMRILDKRLPPKEDEFCVIKFWTI